MIWGVPDRQRDKSPGDQLFSVRGVRHSRTHAANPKLVGEDDELVIAALVVGSKPRKP